MVLSILVIMQITFSFISNTFGYFPLVAITLMVCKESVYLKIGYRLFDVDRAKQVMKKLAQPYEVEFFFLIICFFLLFLAP